MKGESYKGYQLLKFHQFQQKKLGFYKARGIILK